MAMTKQRILKKSKWYFEVPRAFNGVYSRKKKLSNKFQHQMMSWMQPLQCAITSTILIQGGAQKRSELRKRLSDVSLGSVATG